MKTEIRGNRLYQQVDEINIHNNNCDPVDYYKHLLTRLKDEKYDSTAIESVTKNIDRLIEAELNFDDNLPEWVEDISEEHRQALNKTFRSIRYTNPTDLQNIGRGMFSTNHLNRYDEKNIMKEVEEYCSMLYNESQNWETENQIDKSKPSKTIEEALENYNTKYQNKQREGNISKVVLDDKGLHYAYMGAVKVYTEITHNMFVAKKKTASREEILETRKKIKQLKDYYNKLSEEATIGMYKFNITFDA